MKAILVGRESYPYKDVLSGKLRTPWELTIVEELPLGSDSDSAFGDAEVLISVSYGPSFPRIPGLKLIQIPATGLNLIDLDAVPEHVFVCNAYGHQIAIAEYSMLAMLACAHPIFRIHSQFSQGYWYWSDKLVHPTHSELFGKTVCIVGLGSISAEIAKRCATFGIRVIACNRSTDKRVAGVELVRELSQVKECVAQADFVVLACALAEETRNIINEETFAAMKPSAFLINVARSGLVAEESLFHALRTRRIAGAVLDTWYKYPSMQDPQPAPSAFAFHELDNVIMTPHISGWTDGMVERRWSEVAHNLDSVVLGKPLMNLVKS